MERTYIIRERISTCNICKGKQDLRMGVCFDCADYTKAIQLDDDIYKCFDERNPENSWVYDFKSDKMLDDDIVKDLLNKEK